MAPTTTTAADTCAQCDGATEIYDDSEHGTRFTEYYRCVECDAHGLIRGDVNDSTDEWTQTGRVFVA